MGIIKPTHNWGPHLVAFLPAYQTLGRNSSYIISHKNKIVSTEERRYPTWIVLPCTICYQVGLCAYGVLILIQLVSHHGSD